MIDPWERRSERVRVAPLAGRDVPRLRRAIQGSVDRIATWGPTGLESLDELVDLQGPAKRTFLVHALQVDPTAGHALAARINVNDMVMGRLASATLGYDAYDPYAGRGLTREGLALLLDIAFSPAPNGLGLHRVAADVQPANVRSAALLRSLGFVREGHSPRLVRIPTAGDPQDDWRDHDRYALLREDWPASPYAAPAPPRLAVLVHGVPGSGKSTLARRLAQELQVPLIRKDAIKEAFGDALPGADSRELGAGASQATWAVLGESPVGGVVESWWWPHDRERVRVGLTRAGFDPAQVFEVYCDVPIELAAARDRARWEAGERHTVHRRVTDEEWRDAVTPAAAPLGLGPVHRIDTSVPVTDAQVCRLALTIRAGLPATSTPLPAFRSLPALRRD